MAAMRQARGGVLVVGGGFAGGYVARLLGERGATIVSPENFMLYTPMLPEAASGTLEPRHIVVPLRQMCPHAELVLGRVTAIDEERRTAHVETPDAGTFDIGYEHLVLALGAVAAHASRCPASPSTALGFKDLADAINLRNHVLRELEAADAELDPRRRARATSASSSSAPATRASRRSRSSPTSSTTRCAGTRASASVAAALGARRRRAEDPARDPDRGSASTRRRSSPAAASRSTSRRRSSRSTARRPCSRTATRIPTHTLVWTAGVKASPTARRVRDAARRARPRPRRLRSSASRDASASGRSATAPPSRTSATPGRVRPADLPARAPPGAAAREEPPRRAASRTATGCSARWRRSGATRGSPT